MIPNKMLIFLITLFGCNSTEKNNVQTIFYTEPGLSYQEYIEQGYSKIPYNLLILEKVCDDFKIQIEFSSDGKCLISSKWVFDLDSSISIKKNVERIMKSQEVSRVLPILTQDSVYFFFNALTKTNMLLMEKIIDDSYSKNIELSYFHPDQCSSK